jgi:hypothetical protein
LEEYGLLSKAFSIIENVISTNENLKWIYEWKEKMLFIIMWSLYLNEYIEEMKKCYLYKFVCKYSKKCNFYVTFSEFVQRVSHKNIQKQTKMQKPWLIWKHNFNLIPNCWGHLVFMRYHSLNNKWMMYKKGKATKWP